MHSTLSSYKERPCRAKMIGLTACWQKSSTFTHGMLRGRGGGLCLTDLTVHFALDRSQNTFHLAVWLKAWKRGRCSCAEQWEQKFTFTGREIRGQRKRTNGRAGDVATPSHCCCCFDLPCRLCQTSQQTHGQPQNSFFLHSIFKSRYKGSRAVISLLENP